MEFQTHEEYFAAQPAAVRIRLEQIQKVVETQVPGATRTISYNMPAFKKERTFLYVGAFKSHIGIYPPVTDDPQLVMESEPFRGPKGNLSFPHAKDLPLPLIARIAAALELQYGAG